MPPSRATILIFGLIAIFTGIYAPLSFNPDGNYYFGTALRLSQGRILDSIEGYYSPLLSWLMAPLIALGLSPMSAFRLVNLGAYLATLDQLRRICRNLEVRELVTTLATFLTGLHLLYFTTVLVTSDLLATPLYLGMVTILSRKQPPGPRHALYLGLLGSFSYLAKAPQLPIALGFLTLWSLTVLSTHRKKTLSTFRYSIMAILLTGIFSLPWILTLSHKYGTLLFSGQQLLLRTGESIHDYSPVSQAVKVPLSPTGATQKLEALTQSIQLFNGTWQRLQTSIPYLCSTTCGLMFGDFGCIAWGLLVCCGIWAMLKSQNQISQRAAPVIGALTQTGFYLAIWGPYIRYFFPSLPLYHLFFALGAEYLWNRCAIWGKQRSLLTTPRLRWIVGVLITLNVFSLTRMTGLSIVNDWSMKDDSIVEYIANLPELSTDRGILTGNVEEPTAGLVAYRLGREYWASIHPGHRENPGQLQLKLDRWKVSQIIWIARPLPSLDSVPGFTRTGPYTHKGQQVYIYSRALDAE